MPRYAACLTAWALLCTMTSPIASQEQEQEQEQETNPVLEFTRNAAAEYAISVDGVEGELELQEEPALSWSNPVRKSKYGYVYVWTHDGVPQVIACIYLDTLRGWRHEFQSLAPNRLTARQGGATVWSTRRPGIAWSALEAEDAPAETPTLRLVQMRRLARPFQGRVTFNNDELRLMSQPLYRYSNAEDGIIDGAIFALAQGTNPEVLLLLEAKGRGEEQPAWEYALAPMTGYDYEVSLGGEVVGRPPSRGLGVGQHQHIYYNRFIGPVPGSPE